MYELQGKLKSIANVIGERKIIYLDYPTHKNVGDLLIFQGALEFFNSSGLLISAAFSCHNCDFTKIDRLLEKSEEYCIVLHGGGNFGDIYLQHQLFRSEVFKRYPEQRIVLLPQSAHYQSNENYLKDKKIISQLKDAYFFARDEPTLEIFSDMGVASYLSPDIAHSLYKTLPFVPKTRGTLYFLRKDIEKCSSTNNEINQGIDWIDMVSFWDQKMIRLLVHFQKNSRCFSKQVFNFWCWRSKKISYNAAKYFSSHELIVTSRMHGHILSCLLEVNNEVIDNFYGKNSRYFNCWTKKFPLAKLRRNL